MLRKADYHVIRRLYEHYADENHLSLWKSEEENYRPEVMFNI